MAALGQGDRMGKDLADPIDGAARDPDEIVADAQQRFPLDLDIGVKKKVEVLDHGAGERVLDGNDRGGDFSFSSNLKTSAERAQGTMVA